MSSSRRTHFTQLVLLMTCGIIACLIDLSCQSRTEKASPERSNARTVASADGVPISYEVRGTGEPALVFVHCWCCDGTYWRNQADFFGKEYRVVLIDLAGHGESGVDRQSWTFEAFGQDVVAVANDLDLDSMILIGHSMGGPVILEAAVLMPDRVIGLVGVETFADFEVKFSEFQVKSFLNPIQEDFPYATGVFVRNLFPRDADSTLVEEVVAGISSCPPAVGIGSMESYLKLDQAELAEQVTAPIRGINSKRYPVKVESNKEHTLSYEVVYMEGVGHFPQLEDPETFNEILSNTIKEFTGLDSVATGDEK